LNKCIKLLTSSLNLFISILCYISRLLAALPQINCPFKQLFCICYQQRHDETGKKTVHIAAMSGSSIYLMQNAYENTRFLCYWNETA